MADKSDNAKACKKARDDMRRAGMKRGPKFKWIEQDKFDKMLEHERTLASANRDGALDKKPSSYRLKTRRK